MAYGDLLVSRAHGLLHGLERDPRVEDRGPADDVDGLFPVGAQFSLDGATDWLNSGPLSGADLRGRVVLVEFWTGSCINWVRSHPYVRAWRRAYASHGLVVVGVHSPEFSFEHDVDTVRSAALDRGIDHPVAVDNHFAVWRSFDNQYWPAVYLADASGRIRHHAFGEGRYEQTEDVLRRLLVEAGADLTGLGVARVEAHGVEAAADWKALRSTELYLGYDRETRFASPGGLAVERPQRYTSPATLRRGHWALSGVWTVRGESTAAEGAGSRLACRFEARDVHLVMAPSRPVSAVPFRVLVDGRPPGADHGTHVDPAGEGVLTRAGLHHLVRRRGPVVESTVEIEFLAPGVQVCALTFG